MTQRAFQFLQASQVATHVHPLLEDITTSAQGEGRAQRDANSCRDFVPSPKGARPCGRRGAMRTAIGSRPLGEDDQRQIGNRPCFLLPTCPRLAGGDT